MPKSKVYLANAGPKQPPELTQGHGWRHARPFSGLLPRCPACRPPVISSNNAGAWPKNLPELRPTTKTDCSGVAPLLGTSAQPCGPPRLGRRRKSVRGKAITASHPRSAIKAAISPVPTPLGKENRSGCKPALGFSNPSWRQHFCSAPHVVAQCGHRARPHAPKRGKQVWSHFDGTSLHCSPLAGTRFIPNRFGPNICSYSHGPALEAGRCTQKC